MLRTRVKEQDKRIEELDEKLTQSEEGRREDAQTYARGIINLSHKFTTSLHEAIRWAKRR